MSCGCGDNTPFGGNDAYNNLCNTDTPYPIVSAESVPSLISNLTFALYGQIQKDVSNGKVVWIIPCDPNNTAFIGDVPRLPGEGLMCYFIRYFNTVYTGGTLAIEYGGTGAGTAQAALSNLGGASAAQQIITAPSSGLSGGGTLAADRSLSIANTTVVPGTYGANNRIPVLTVNARGQLTGATTIAAEGFASVDGEVITAADPSPNVRQTVFNLTSIIYSPGTDNLAVYRNGLRLLVGQDYIETNSSTVTLTRGVAAGNQFLFESGRIIGQDVSSVAVATQRIVAVNPAPGIQQTVFNLTAITYIPGNNSLAVYSNGLKLSLGLDYTETNSATVTLTNGATAGDQLTFEAGKMLSQPVSATVQTQTITSSLGQTVFVLTTLSYAPNIGNLAVYKDGLRLISGTDYAETNSNTVTLAVPALAGRQFMFEVGQTLAQPAPVAAASELKTATANQTQFTLTGLTYVPNTLSLSVYRNGLKLISGTDYTETNSNTVTLTSPAALGDQLVFEAGKILSQGVAGSSVLFVQSGTGAVTRNIQNKARESVSVLDFGAVGNGTTDDTAAIQAAIDSLGAGGGSVMIDGGRYLLDTSLTIKKSISIVGPHQFTGTPGNNSSAPYDTMGGALILNSSATITIESGASLTGVLIHRKGMTFPAADSAAYAGTAVTIGGDDASVSSCMILGFNKAVYSSNFQRPKLYDLQIDSQNGIEITLCYDIPRIENVHCWPFATIAATGTSARNHRSGNAFYLHDSVDGAMLSNCFSYGYLNGFYLKNIAVTNASNCVSDNTTAYNSSAGWRFEGNINGFNCSSGAAYSCGNGIVIDVVSTQFIPIHNFFLAGHTFNAIAITLGNADIAYNYITTTPTAVSVASSLSVVKFDFNTLATISTNFVYSSAASTTNTRIGAGNFVIDTQTGSLASGTILSPGVTAADPLQIPNFGEVFNVVGATGFGGLAGGWAGRKVSLLFTGSLTVFNSTGAASNMRLSGGANFSAVAGSTLTLQHNGTQWYEIGRSA